MTLPDWAEHMMKFHDGRFGTHPRFRFLVFNTIMRHCARELRGFFVSRNPDLKALSIDVLKERLQLGGHR